MACISWHRQSGCQCVDNVDNVDNHENAALENQNSGCGSCFSKETSTAEKDHMFADREVEAMFRKILGRKNGEGMKNGAPKPEDGAGRGQGFPETKRMGSEKQDSAAADSKIQEVREAKCNDTECNNTEFNETDDNDTNMNDTDYFYVYQILSVKSVLSGWPDMPEPCPEPGRAAAIRRKWGMRHGRI